MSDPIEPHTEPTTTVSCHCGWSLENATPHQARAAFHIHECLLRTFTADGRDATRALIPPELRAAMVPRHPSEGFPAIRTHPDAPTPDCAECDDTGVTVDDPAYISGLSPRNDWPQHDPKPCRNCSRKEDPR